MDDSTSSNIHHQAISAALEARWDDALKLNKKIIKFDPQNVDGLARLGRAYMEMGRFNLAKKFYNEALKYDPYNPIASKNLKIIKSFKSNSQPKIGNGHSKLSSSLFLQEPGKSKIVNLLSLLIRETFRSKRFKNQPSFLEGSSSPHLEMITSIDDEEDENSDEEGEQEA